MKTRWMLNGLMLCALGACTQDSLERKVTAVVELGAVEELTLVHYPVSGRPYVKIVLLNDGTAVKRDLSARRVFHASFAPEQFLTIARHISLLQTDTERPGDLEAALVRGEKRQRISASKSTFNQRLIRAINQELDKIHWNQI